MSRRPRRNHPATFKAKVAVEAVKGEKTIAEIAQKQLCRSKAYVAGSDFWKSKVRALLRVLPP